LKKPQIDHWIKVTLVSLLVLVVICIVVLASVPPVSRDALIHHLAIPKLYLENGGIYEIPDARWSYYPMNIDLLYLIPLYFGNDVIPKYIHFVFAMLTALLIFRYLKKRLDVMYALLGVVVFLSLPIIVKLSITAYVDLGLIFFSTAALFYFLKWVNHEFKLKFLLVSAFWCGLGLGTKYNALIVLFLLTLFAIFIYARNSADIDRKQSKAVGFGIVFMLVALFVFSPWAMRNYKWTHNPIYPLYDTWFNQTKDDLHDSLQQNSIQQENENPAISDIESKGKWTHFTVRRIIFNEKWWEIILIPIRIFFQGQDDNPKYFDGKLNPLLFLLPFFAFIGFKHDSQALRIEKKISMFYAALFILFAFVQRDMRIRYIGPTLPPLVILSIFGLANITRTLKERSDGFPRKIYLGIVFSGVLFSLGLNFSYVLNQFRWVQPLKYLKGEIKRDAYIEKYRPEYAVLKYANNNLAADAKILGVFQGNRSYYSAREIRFDFHQFIQQGFKQQYSEEKILDNFKNSGISHLLIRYDLFNTWIQNNFNESEKQKLNLFLKNYAVLIFSKNGHGLYRLEFTRPLGSADMSPGD
jgi:hypothetical protein